MSEAMLKPPPKRYPIDQSRLFRLNGKEKFKSLIGIDWDAVAPLLISNPYRVWLNEKKREIQQPTGKLDAVHRRIGDLLSRIRLPEYVYSQKGRSYADNARQHLGATPLIKTDIHKFYPSTTWHMVNNMFLDDFQCPRDVAKHLADICCYKQAHLPTGSAVSGRIAFLAARPMFDELDKTVSAHECFMSVYVDDITISGNNASKLLLGKVREIVHKHGLLTKEEKSKTYAAADAKPVTGAVIAAGELRLPNERHKRIHEVRKELAVAPDIEKPHIQRVLRGRLQEAKQILKQRG